MRAALLVVLVATPAYADVSAGASIGAGAQGAATYGALEVRFESVWRRARLGLGARGIWDDAVFRTSDWDSIGDAIAIVRDAEVTHTIGETQLGIAAGALAPSVIGHVVDGYRVALDDRWRTGVRAAAWHDHLDVALELDDVLDPALVAGGVRWAMSPPYAMHLALAIDPRAPAMDGTHRATAIEAGAGRRIEGDRLRADVGVSIVAELSLGASVVAFGSAELERWGVRFTGRADVRAGTGTVGSRFGPLYRIERLAHDGRASLWDRANAGELDGASAGFAVGATVPGLVLELGARARPGIGGLVTAGAAAPMNRYVQAGAWTAIGRSNAAAASELRIAWAKTLFSAFQAARIYRLDAMEPIAVWSVTAWFGAATE